VQRGQYWIAALAIAQFGIAIALCGMASNAGGGSALSLSLMFVLGGAAVTGFGLGALTLGRAWKDASGSGMGRFGSAGRPGAEGAYRWTDDAELTQLAETAGGDPFRELLRPMVHVDSLRGVAFSTREGLTLSARLPQGLDADEVSAQAPAALAPPPEWLADSNGSGADGEFTIRNEGDALVVLARGPILLSGMVDETAGENGAAHDWLEATAAAGARLWTIRYDTEPETAKARRSATLS